MTTLAWGNSGGVRLGTGTILTLLCFALPALGEPARISTSTAQPVVEVQVNESLLRSFRVTGRETRPRWDHGVWVTPDIVFNGYPTLQDASHNIHVNLNIDMNGTARGGKSQRVLGRTAGAHSTSYVRGHFEKPLYFTGNGVSTGPLRGSPSISVNVQTYNNFRLPLLRRLAHRKARQKAMQEMAVRLPQSRAQITRQVGQTVSQAADAANGAFKQTLAKIHTVLDDPNEFPFQVGLSSQATRPGQPGNLKVTLRSPNGAGREPRPPLEHEAQAASVVHVHKDALEQSMAPQLAGKQMRLADVHRILCGGEFAQALQFCQQDMPEEARQTSILFADTNPVQFDFEDGEIRMTLNALYQIHKEEDVNRSGNLLTEPSAPDKTQLRTAPYSVEVVYKLSGDHVERARVQVREPATGGELKDPPPDEGSHNPLDRFLADSVRGMLNPIVKNRIQASFEKAFKQRIELSPVSLPSRVLASPGGKPTPQGALSLVPLETKAESGWLVSTQAMCSPETSSLGISFQLMNDSTKPSLAITSVVPGSPADLAGLKAGDRLFWFRSDHETTPHGIGSSYQQFLDSVKETSAQKTSQARTLHLVGLDGQRQRFEKSVVLCPNWIDHAEQAQKLVGTLTQIGR